MDAARALLGCRLRRGGVVLRITETEAYAGPEDSASHCRFGRTPRNEPMWGPPGRAYVYLCYGMHVMLNIVTGEEGEGAAVLIRACEPVAGIEVVQARRGGKSGPMLLTGPGKVGQALALDTGFSGQDLCAPGGLELLAGAPPVKIARAPRIGVDYATPADQRRLWRFADSDSPWVTHRKLLRPIR